MPQKQIEVLVIDDDSIARQGLAYILSKSSEIIIAAEAEDGTEGLREIHEGTYDVVLLDIIMPGKDSLDVLKEAKAAFPKLPVLILTTSRDDNIATRFLRAGASGFVTKDISFDQLTMAIKKVYAGEKYLSNELMEKLAYRSLGDNKEPHENLTDREYQVMLLIRKGKSPTEMAQELFISPKTVSTHRAHILKKLNLKSSAEIMHYCFERKMS